MTQNIRDGNAKQYSDHMLNFGGIQLKAIQT